MELQTNQNQNEERPLEVVREVNFLLEKINQKAKNLIQQNKILQEEQNGN